MKIHHIGYVKQKSFLFKFKKQFKKHLYDKKQKNFIFFKYSKKFNLWLEYIIPESVSSTVYKFSIKKNNNKIHHFGFKTDDISKEKKKLIKNNYILINSFKINVPCFGGLIKTYFFYDGKNIIELLSNVKK